MQLRFHSFLLVCTGNICRSPMAAWLLHERLALAGARVASAGVGAVVGHPADETASAVMAEKGYDLAAHRGRQFTAELAADFELVLVMETWQQSWIERNYPTLHGRVQRLGHWLDEDIPDPIGRSPETYRAVRDQIEAAVASWVERLRQ